MQLFTVKYRQTGKPDSINKEYKQTLVVFNINVYLLKVLVADRLRYQQETVSEPVSKCHETLQQHAERNAAFPEVSLHTPQLFLGVNNRGASVSSDQAGTKHWCIEEEGTEE